MLFLAPPQPQHRDAGTLPTEPRLGGVPGSSRVAPIRHDDSIHLVPLNPSGAWLTASDGWGEVGSSESPTVSDISCRLDRFQSKSPNSKQRQSPTPLLDRAPSEDTRGHTPSPYALNIPARGHPPQQLPCSTRLP